VRGSTDERLTRYRRDGSAQPVVPVRFVPLVEDAGGD
jgi:hypothetical protein